MEDIGRAAHVVSKHMSAQWERLEPIGREEGLVGVIAAASQMPVIQDVLAQASAEEFEQVVERAWDIATRRAQAAQRRA